MIENRARLRIVRPGEKPPVTNVVSFSSREERAINADPPMEPEVRSGWMHLFKDLNPQEADVMWRILMDENEDAIAEDLGISVTEVQAIRVVASVKIGGQISS
jgi:FixJ family two-component response regulator